MDNTNTAPNNHTAISPDVAAELMLRSLELSLASQKRRADAAWAVINEDWWRNNYDDLAAIAMTLSEPVTLMHRALHAEAKVEAAITANRAATSPATAVAAMAEALTDTAAPEVEAGAALTLLANPVDLISRADHAEVIIGMAFAASAVADELAAVNGMVSALRGYDRFDEIDIPLIPGTRADYVLVGSAS
jgi:hypothetical protein